jgi:cytochrome c oxidase subunit 3
MSPESTLLTPEERDELELTALVRHQLEEQFENLEQQHEASALGMWIFLATEVLFFGVLFLGVGVYRYRYPEAFEAGSERLNWQIGGINTLVLLVSSLMMVLAVHYASVGDRKRLLRFLVLTAGLGLCFLVLKGLEYYLDYRENLIPGWRFDESEWTWSGLSEEERQHRVQHVQLFLIFYWVMTGLHALHMTIGIIAVLVLFALARRNYFSPTYYVPVDVTALYWHFVDIVWIFLLPMLYLQGTHSLGS